MRLFSIISLMIFSFLTNAASSNDIVLGEITPDKLIASQPNFSLEKTSGYSVNSDPLEKLKSYQGKATIKVFFGSWCHDSIREVPRIIKVLQLANNPSLSLQLYGIGDKKQKPKQLVEEYSIQYTPTIVIEKKAVELARFIEHPKTEWVTDFANTLAMN